MTDLITRVKSYLRSHASGETTQGGTTFTGDYACWADAVRDSSGYATGTILERTRDALLKVKRGEAAWERDSVLLDTPDHPFPLLAALLRAAVLDEGRLVVLDFGGSLGSSYFACRRFVSGVRTLEWCVVEQPAHVACGRELFEDAELRFFDTPDACVARHQVNVLLLSSTLPYLSDPYATLAELLALGIRHVVIDRTGFLVSGRDRLTVQRVDPSIYPASYPAWFFNESRFAAMVAAAGYSLVAEFPRPDHDYASPADERAYYKGFIYQKADRD